MPLEKGTLSQGTDRLGQKLEKSSPATLPQRVQGDTLEQILEGPESGVLCDLGRFFPSTHRIPLTQFTLMVKMIMLSRLRSHKASSRPYGMPAHIRSRLYAY